MTVGRCRLLHIAGGVLLGSLAIVASCSILYESLFSSLSRYALGPLAS